MIVPMKKLTVITLSEEKRATIKTLQELGAVHITSSPKPQNSVYQLHSQIENLKNIIGHLPTDENAEIKEVENIQEISDKLHNKIKELDDLNKKLAELTDELSWFRIWGEISLDEIRNLENNGVKISFYEIPRKFQDICQRDDVFVLAREQKLIRIANITNSDVPEIFKKFSKVQLPALEACEIKQKIEDCESAKKKIEIELAESAGFKSLLEAHLSQLNKQLRFENATASLENHGEVEVLQGFIPVDKVETAKICAEKNNWSYVLEEPSEKDDPPTLLRNPKWVTLINPILKFMGTIPGYREVDISMWFLISLSIFFAMLIGDVGYGILFLAITVFAQKKFKKAPKQPFILVYLFSFCTIIWGTLTGTWFGSEVLAQLPIIRHLTIPEIASFTANGDFNDNQNFLMWLCFIIGASHLSIARLMNFFKHLGSLKMLAQVGWISIIWGLYFVVQYFVFNKEMPEVAIWLLIIGFALVTLFNDIQKNIFKGILTTLGNLPLKIISSFSDVVSYLRLFAVGYASLVVAHSFNQMALGGGIDNPLSGFLAALVLFLGHSLNIALALMGIVVHGVRLNTLEFSGHADLEWSGKKYTPFN